MYLREKLSTVVGSLGRSRQVLVLPTSSALPATLIYSRMTPEKRALSAIAYWKAPSLPYKSARSHTRRAVI